MASGMGRKLWTSKKQAHRIGPKSREKRLNGPKGPLFSTTGETGELRKPGCGPVLIRAEKNRSVSRVGACGPALKANLTEKTMIQTPRHEFNHLGPDDRRREIARILAAGVLRLHSRAALAVAPDATTQKNPEDSGQNCLEVPADPRLSVHTGLRHRDPRKELAVQLNIAKEVAALQRMTSQGTAGALRRSVRRAHERQQQGVARQTHRLAVADCRRKATCPSGPGGGPTNWPMTPTCGSRPRGSWPSRRRRPSARPRGPWSVRATTGCHQPDSVITRRYKDEDLQVKVLTAGFEFEGEVYKSLSAVAKTITGQHCNGFLFFRLGQGVTSMTDQRKPAAVQPTVRCAVYTRKSTEEGLEQEFNSLDAQREAGEAFIRSQAREGWTCLPDRLRRRRASPAATWTALPFVVSWPTSRLAKSTPSSSTK